jgi:hypothetical protein
MLVIVGHYPFSVKERPRSAAVMRAAVYSALSAGRAVGTAQILWGSLLSRLWLSLIAALFLWWLWCNRCCET